MCATKKASRASTAQIERRKKKKKEQELQKLKLSKTKQPPIANEPDAEDPA
jgi:hypothetical protein